MIYAYTLNPALDVTGSVNKLIPNEKNYISEVQYLPGGNGINAGIIAKRLGAQIKLRGFLGGSNGETIRKYLDQEEIDHYFIQIENETRMNVTISNRDDHLQTRLSFPGPIIKEVEVERFLVLNEDIFQNSIVILGGSLPPGIEIAHLQDAMGRWKENNCRILIDIPSVKLKELIPFRPDFIKPNLKEFQELVDKEVTEIKTILPIAQNLLSHIPNICISSVEGGALFITKEEVWFGKIPPIEVVSTVGAGDSMVGAIAHTWDLDKSAKPETLLRAGLSASWATLTKKGSTLGDANEIKKFLSDIILQKIV